MAFIYRRPLISGVGAGRSRHCLCILIIFPCLTIFSLIVIHTIVLMPVDLPGFKLNISAAKPYYQARFRSLSLGHAGDYEEERLQINLAVAACEDRGREDVIAMLKSALIFSQDAHLYLYIFSNAGTIDLLREDVSFCETFCSCDLVSTYF